MEVSRTASVLQFKLTKPESSGRRSPKQITSVHSRNSATGETIMTRQSSNGLDVDHTITRRKFIGTTALSSAALLSGGLASLLRPTSAFADEPFIEATIPELQALMASGQLTTKQLVMGYLD